jgi:hypothetical protein
MQTALDPGLQGGKEICQLVDDASSGDTGCLDCRSGVDSVAVEPCQWSYLAPPVTPRRVAVDSRRGKGPRGHPLALQA